MITTTLGALVQAEEALGRLAAQRLPIKAAYQLSKLLRLVPAETKHFHEQKNAFVKELGKERDCTPLERQRHGPTITEVTPENRAAFFAKIEELSTLAVALDAQTVPLADIEDITISAADLIALEPFTAEPPVVKAEKPKRGKR